LHCLDAIRTTANNPFMTFNLGGEVCRRRRLTLCEEKVIVQLNCKNHLQLTWLKKIVKLKLS